MAFCREKMSPFFPAKTCREKMAFGGKKKKIKFAGKKLTVAVEKWISAGKK